MNTLNTPLILFDQSEASCLRDELADYLKCFYTELNLVLEHNSIDDFQDWFSERTFLTLFFNGMIRNDRSGRRTVIQEYCTGNIEYGNGHRCDGFISDHGKAILFEAKRLDSKIQENYFDVDDWIRWDEDKIRPQLKKYLACDENFFLKGNRYSECYLLTICFKTFKRSFSEHIVEATKTLSAGVSNKLNRQWYYSLASAGADTNQKEISNLIEVYGTITNETKKIINTA